nr:hypothetical protein [Tanacetum cinerariifolium]
MSAMANTAPIVTTVTKPTTNPRDADATPKVNIQDFCEEYYEDILPIIMDKVRRDKRKEVHARVDLTDLAKLTHQAQPSSDQARQALGIVLMVEATLIGRKLLMEFVLKKSKPKSHKPTDEDDLTMPWMCEEVEARKLRIKDRHYELLEGVLYRWSFLTWLRCVGPLQADYVIREIHEGSCSMHVGPRSVVAKALRLGYYWPTMHRDARDMIRTCNDCQIYRPVTRSPQQPLTMITASWPFYKWGINIAGPFLKAPERANRSLGEGIKARLGEGKHNYVEELPHVLWAHRAMIKSSHGDTPFSLTYETKAVIPAEIGMPTYRTAAVDAVYNDEELRLNFDLLEERRERVAIREAKAKLKMTKYYNARVRDVTFRPGDFVYRSNDASHAVDGGNLRPKWEVPYEYYTRYYGQSKLYMAGKDLDLSNLGDASFSDVSVCVAVSGNMMARHCGATISADVVRGHDGDGGSDDRPPPYHVPTGCGGCLGNRGKGTRKPNLGGRRAGRLHTRQETRNLGLKAITDKSGPGVALALPFLAPNATGAEGEGRGKDWEVRTILDDIFFHSVANATRWVKYIPIKINVFAWRARLDRLPARSNLVRRGVVLDSYLCPLCGFVPEDIHHVLFRCDTAKLVFRKICRWIKLILEGVFYVAWWHLWVYRNQSIFAATPPRRLSDL